MHPKMYSHEYSDVDSEGMAGEISYLIPHICIGQGAFTYNRVDTEPGKFG